MHSFSLALRKEIIRTASSGRIVVTISTTLPLSSALMCMWRVSPFSRNPSLTKYGFELPVSDKSPFRRYTALSSEYPCFIRFPSSLLGSNSILVRPKTTRNSCFGMPNLEGMSIIYSLRVFGNKLMRMIFSPNPRWCLLFSFPKPAFVVARFHLCKL